MHTSEKNNEVEPIGVRVTPDLLSVELADGRIVSVPTEWFPRLAHGTPSEWANFELMFNGIYWSDLNEDISIDGLFRGEKSGESPDRIKRWLDLRSRGEKELIPELPLPPSIARELEEMGILNPKPARNRRRAVGMARRK